MANVVPHIRDIAVVRKSEGFVEAGERHIVLGGVEAAETHIVPELRIVDSALNEATVETEGHLWLVCVKMVASERGYRFYVLVIIAENILVLAGSLGHIIE